MKVVSEEIIFWIYFVKATLEHERMDSEKLGTHFNSQHRNNDFCNQESFEGGKYKQRFVGRVKYN